MPSTLEAARPREFELFIHAVEDGSIQDGGNIPFEPRARQGALEADLCTSCMVFLLLSGASQLSKKT